MMMTLLDAEIDRDLGMSRALDHAERDTYKWGDLAYAFLCRYARAHAEFISEDVSDAARAWGMISPENDRAWGHVYRRAQKQRVITMVGVGRSRRRHASICPRWASNVYGGNA